MEIWDLYDEKGNKTGETWERSRAKEIPSYIAMRSKKE